MSASTPNSNEHYAAHTPALHLLCNLQNTRSSVALRRNFHENWHLKFVHSEKLQPVLSCCGCTAIEKVEL